jgi:hypothetical protein
MGYGWGSNWGYNYGGEDELLVGDITASLISNNIALSVITAGCAISGVPSIQVDAIAGVEQ